MDGDGKKPLKTVISNLKCKFMKEIGQLRTGKHLSEELKSSKKD